MNRTKYFMAVMIFIVASCTREPFTGDVALSELPAGMVRVELITNTGNYQVPATRAEADETITTPWVLVFTGTDDNATFSEACKSVAIGSKLYVNLTKTNSSSRLLIIANAPDSFRETTDASGVEYVFDEQTLESRLSGKTLAQAADMLLTPFLSAPADPYRGSAVPMSATLDLGGGINSGTAINNDGTVGSGAGPLNLRRTVARVAVVSTASGFDLKWASAANAPNCGALIRLAGRPILSNSSNLTDYAEAIAPAAASDGAQTTEGTPIYLYESSEETTSIIVCGTYRGTDYYYRLQFRTPGGRVNVERNHKYLFRIESVSSEGYATFGEAARGEAQNLKATVDVFDESSLDIADNGVYYLGIDNSEVVFYTDAGLTQSMTEAFTVTTDATSAMFPNGIVITRESYPAGGIETSPSPTEKIMLNPSGITSRTVNLTVFSRDSAVVNLILGNLTKTVIVKRKRSLSFTTNAVVMPRSGYVGAESKTSWLTVGNTPYPEGASSSVRDNDADPATGSLKDYYMFTTLNPTTAGRTGKMYLYRSGNQGRALVYVEQKNIFTASGGFNLDSEPLGKVVYFNGTANATYNNNFVGTFHRNDEVGERIIRIPVISPYQPTAWSATVVSGIDFITLAMGGSSDPNIYTDHPGNAEDYPVVDGSVSITSTTLDTEVLFRVGMKTKNPNPYKPRYGLIEILHNRGRHYIWVRQGEAADYLMRPTDPATGTWQSPNRPAAVRISPYNLSDPNRGTGGSAIANHSLMPVGDKLNGRPFDPRKFTDYPSQAGYFFQWNLGKNPTQCRAFHPTNPYGTGNTISGWDGTEPALTSGWDPTREPCPTGYRHPNDGGSAVYDPAVVDNSEVRQSIAINPAEGYPNSLITNMVYGCYADGFFDRHCRVQNPMPTANPSPIPMVSFDAANPANSANTNVAYYGALYINPYNNASLFMPYAGNRHANYGPCENMGMSFSYWASSDTHVTGSFPNGGAFWYNGSISVNVKRFANSVRCVKE